MRFERMMLAMGTLGGALVATVIGAPAQAAMNPLDAIAVCARINKKDARLECYDQVARDAASGALPAAYGASIPSAAPGWAAPPPPQASGPAAPTTQGFGSEQLRSSSSNPARGPDEIQAAVTSSKDNGLGQWQITLADGAIWRMTESVSLFRPPAPNETVTIRRGALGGFLMDVGKQASVRVARVR